MVESVIQGLVVGAGIGIIAGGVALVFFLFKQLGDAWKQKNKKSDNQE